MKTAIYSVHKFERDYLVNANNDKLELVILEEVLTENTLKLAASCKAICIFVSDKTTAPVLNRLFALGINFIALRSAGYNHVDLIEAKKLNIKLARVPEYSPYSVAEHAIALMLALNRQLIHAHNRINEHNFSLGLRVLICTEKQLALLVRAKLAARFG